MIISGWFYYPWSNYRIYLRISREILDKIWPIFLQFDLYPGHKTYRLNWTKFEWSSFKGSYFGILKLKHYEFWTIFCKYLFISTYIRRLTYTRVYMVSFLANKINRVHRPHVIIFIGKSLWLRDVKIVIRLALG